MVFESVVAQLLNRVLGDYVENLDASQLNIGIFGGDVRLQSLDIKATALDALDLPVKLKFGYLSNLVLKIPWKNLYTEPVVATIEGLHVLVVPNLGIKYDDEKERKQQQSKKDGELTRLEEARKLRRKSKEQTEESEAAQDSFAEKMVTQIIKNLQVSIRDIHVRYEDCYTNKERPFAAGVTLNGLEFQTTDCDWKKCIITEAVKQVYKMVELDSLAVYWNSGTKLMSDLSSTEEIKKQMQSVVATKESKPNNYSYVLQPISIDSKLRLNTKPESDNSNWTIPKILLNVEVAQLGVHVGKYQYQDILCFLDAQERFVLNGKYRKYRPDVSKYRGESKKWWHFAYECILEEQVRRRARNWSWAHMKAHRQLVKQYKEAWIEKLTNKSPSGKTKAIMEKAEKQLDVFNLNVSRQQADMEVERRGLTRVEDQQGWIGWAGSWLGYGKGSAKPQEATKPADFAAQFEAEMTPEEKAKLFDAIDYQENAPPTSYPIEYVENKVSFTLHKLDVVVDDNPDIGKTHEVMRYTLTKVVADVEQRPADRAMSIITSLKNVEMKGITSKSGAAPVIMKLGIPVTDKSPPLIALNVQIRPLSRAFDQGVTLTVQPLHVVYHAPTINAIAVVFRPPEAVRLNQLAETAMARYEDVKVRSATGLASAVENRTKLMLDIKVMPTMVIVPETGIYTKTSSLLVADLGSLSVKTVDSVAQTETKSSDDRLQKLMSDAYDNISVELQSLQLLYAKATDDWNSARKKPLTPLHLLQPTGFNILVQKSTIEDLQIPKIKITAALPDMILNLSDERLLEVLKLLLSIPPPPPGPAEPLSPIEQVPVSSLKDRAKMRAIMEVQEVEEAETPSSKSEESVDGVQRSESTDGNAQMVQLEGVFTLNTIALNVSRRGKDGVDSPYMAVRVRSLGADVRMRTFDLVASAHLGNIEVEMMHFKEIGKTDGHSLFLVENPLKEEADGDLLTLKFIQANRQSPQFDTEYGSVEQRLQVRFSALHVALQQRALVDLKAFADQLQSKLEAVRALQAPPVVAEPEPEPPALQRSTSTASLASVGSRFSDAVAKMSPLRPSTGSGRKKSMRSSGLEVIKTKVEASLGLVKLTVGTDKSHITTVGVSDLKADVIMREDRILLETTLKSVWIHDEHPRALHPHLLSVTGDEVFSLRVIQFTRTEEEKLKMEADEVDLDVTMMTNELRFIFLNAWLNRLLTWVAPFQEDAQIAAAQASVALSETALETAKAIKAQPPKVRLNIDLKAPTIFIPQRSSSAEAIVVNLGRVSMANQFVKTKVADGTVILDKLTLNLAGLQIARAVLGDNYTMVAHCEMLEPMSLTLQVQRNLVFDWHKKIPELKLTGDIPVIKMSLSQEDYAMLMKTMSGNLAEGTPPPAARPAAKPQAIEASVHRDTSVVENRRASTMAVIETRPATTPELPSTPSVKIDMDLTLRGLEARLYSGTSHLIKGLSNRREAQKFASVILSTVAIQGNIMDDNAMNIQLCVTAFTMDDEREHGKTSITRLLDKKEGKKDLNLIDISINKTANEDQNVSIKMCAFFLCLNPEFLGSLSRFFIVPAELSDAPTTPITASSASTGSKPQAPPPPPPVSKGKLRVRAELDSAEIILVEDASNPDKTQAVILQLRMEADVAGDADGMTVMGGVKDLEIFSSYYAIEKRKDKLKVLAPCSIDVLMKQNEAEGQKVSVEMTDIELRCTPAIIRLLSAVAAGMGAPEEISAEEKRRKLEQTLSDSSRLSVWRPKTLQPLAYWFFRDVLEQQSEAVVTAAEAIEIDEPVYGQKQELVFTLKSVEVRLEAGVGDRTVPLILMESSLAAQASNWSSQLIATATSSVQVRYYNEMLSCWEPVVEPIEDKRGGYKPWELTLQVQNHTCLDVDEDSVTQMPPKMSISIYSTDILQMTVTKSCLDVLTKLGDAFQRAAKQIAPPTVKALPGTSPYVVKNETGIPIAVMPSPTLTFLDQSATERRVEHGEMIEMDFTKKSKSSDNHSSMSGIDEYTIMLRFGSESAAAGGGGASTVREVNVSRAQLRSFSLPAKSSMGDQWQLISQVTTEYGRRLVTLRSALQVVNHLKYPIEVYSLVDTNLEDCGRAEPDAGVLNVPLPAVYSPNGQFFFKPVVGNDVCEVTAESLNWREFGGTLVSHTLMRSGHTNNGRKGFYIQAISSVEPSLRENTTKRTLSSQSFRIDLRPPVVFRNALPYPVSVVSLADANDPQAATRLGGGESVPLHSVLPGKSKLKLTVSAAEDYHCEFTVKEDMAELQGFDFKTESKKTMTLGVRSVCTNGRHEFTIYCPFWMVNETGLTIAYKKSSSSATDSGDASSSLTDNWIVGRLPLAIKQLWPIAKQKVSDGRSLLSGAGVCSCCSANQTTDKLEDQQAANATGTLEHPPNMGEALMFSFPNKDFNTSKKAVLRVSDSDWSDAFPLDVVGSSGRITCKNAQGKVYDVSIKVTLANSGLTKICVFTPFYLINNQCDLPVAVSEGANGDVWQTVEAETCSGFWPTVSLSSEKKPLLRARYVDEFETANAMEPTTPFPYTENFESLAKLNSAYIGIYLTVGVGESQVVITLEDYQKGMAPALLINSTEHPVTFRQHGVSESQLLEPQTELYFGWNDLTANRELVWSCGSLKDVKDGLFKDGYSSFTKQGSDVPLYWTSFLNGRQRVLLFADDVAVTTTATQAYEIEQIEQQITISLHGIGISLVNNYIGIEIAYMCIMSSGVLWEMQKKRFKAMSLKECQRIEAAYSKYQTQVAAGSANKTHPVAVGGGMEVDFKEMSVVKPKKAKIRRIFQTGLWLQYKTSQHQVHFHVKLNHLQIDNQLPGCVFKVVLAPVPAAKTVAADSAPKPFTEMSFVMRKTEHSNVAQIKYFKVLVQEMALQADKGFINSLIALIQNADEESAQYGRELYNKDIELTKVNLSSVAAVTSSTEAKAFYDMLHFSPLKVHLSFSQGGHSNIEDSDDTAVPIQSEFLNLLLKSVGVTLTEIQDVIFKLAYFERQHVFLNQPQLIAEATDHYTKQAIKQIYVLVLGLDIIGNPFGLLRDLTSGVEDFFYEPISGAVQGPEEFAEGLATGVKSLVGHAVGGAAGAVSRITGTLGKGIAALTLDDEYQRKRQEALNRRPANFGEGIAQGGKGLVTGVFDGVTGVFSKPLEGAQQEGVSGFAKGLGKGLIGVVVRPASGLVDFASGSLDAVKKVVDVTQEVKPVRAARYVHQDKIIRPYSTPDAEGYRLLRECEKAKYAATDAYIAHAPLNETNKFFLFVTDHRILLGKRSNIFGSLEEEWQYTWDELKQCPKMVNETSLRIEFREVRAKVMGMFGGTKGKTVQFTDAPMAKWIADKIVETYTK